MSLSIEFEPEASLELSHTASWYEDRRPSLGLDFLGVVDVTVQRIAQRRLPGSRVPGLAETSPIRRVPVPRFPYQIVYIVVDDVVRVLAVAHDRQRPQYWAGRVTG